MIIENSIDWVNYIQVNKCKSYNNESSERVIDDNSYEEECLIDAWTYPIQHFTSHVNLLRLILFNDSKYVRRNIIMIIRNAWVSFSQIVAF